MADTIIITKLTNGNVKIDNTIGISAQSIPSNLQTIKESDGVFVSVRPMAGGPVFRFSYIDVEKVIRDDGTEVTISDQDTLYDELENYFFFESVDGGSSGDYGNSLLSIEYYAEIDMSTGTTGSITFPTGSSLDTNKLSDLENAYLSTLNDSDKITFETPTNSNGGAITANLISDGTWGASEAYTGNTNNLTALIFYINVSLSDYSTWTNSELSYIAGDTIIDQAIDISYDNSSSGLTATNVQSAIDEISDSDTEDFPTIMLTCTSSVNINTTAGVTIPFTVNYGSTMSGWTVDGSGVITFGETKRIAIRSCVVNFQNSNTQRKNCAINLRKNGFIDLPLTVTADYARNTAANQGTLTMPEIDDVINMTIITTNTVQIVGYPIAFSTGSADTIASQCYLKIIELPT